MKKRAVERLISQNKIKTVTVDIFDTILLRKTWPEDLQFLAHAKAVLPLLHRHINGTITAYEFYSFRQYARRVWYAGRTIALQTENDKKAKTQAYDAFTESLLRADPEINITDWFALTVNMLAEKYDVRLTKSQADILVGKLIAQELATERAYLRPNKPLIAWLRRMQSQHGVQVFYLSDMYLGRQQIHELLKGFGLDDVFQDGTSSADVGAGKWNGKVFAHLTMSRLFDDFELGSNVHIGDNRISDHARPLQAGSNAVWYRTPYISLYRPLYDWFGRKKLAHIQKTARRDNLKVYVDATKNRKTVREELRHAGRIFALPTLYYLDYVLYRSQISGEKLLFVSSEAAMFDQYSRALHSLEFLRGAYETANKINRKNVLSALLWTLGRQGRQGHVDTALADVIRYGERLSGRQEMIAFITGNKHAYGSGLALEHVSEKQFTDYMSSELRAQVSKPDSRLKVAKELVDKQLQPIIDAEAVTLVDVGWGGSTQMFLQNYFQLIGKQELDLRGVYIGAFTVFRFKSAFMNPPEGIVMRDVAAPENRPLFVPEMWEYIYTNKHKNDNKLLHIQEGIQDGIAAYRQNLHMSPEDVWAVGRQELTRLFQNPTRREVGLLGSVTIDAGFNKTEMVPMVATNSSTKRQYFNLFAHPRRFYGTITAQYCWTAGYLKWYHMGWLKHCMPVVQRYKRYLKRR